jgi:hypothetical protein
VRAFQIYWFLIYGAKIDITLLVGLSLLHSDIPGDWLNLLWVERVPEERSQGGLSTETALFFDRAASLAA